MLRALARFAFVLLVIAAAVGPFGAALPSRAVGSPPMPPIKLVTPHPSGPMDAIPIESQTDAGLPAPGALHYSSSVTVCKQQGASDLDCSSLATKGALVFYASWNCSGTCTISGFKLKYAPAKFSPRTATQRGGTWGDVVDVSSSRALFVEMPPSGGWKGQCYVVSAFRDPTKGSISDGSGAYVESPPSPSVCVTATT